MRGHARTWAVLLVVAVLVAALGVYRASSAPSPSSMPSSMPSGAGIAPVVPEGLPTLLDFGRGECIPCQKMMPVLRMLVARHEGRIAVRYLDLAEPDNHQRATEMRVRIIPTQILLDAAGAERDRHEGFWALDEIEARLEELGWTTRR